MKSYSKIKHILETNILLEQRRVKEKNNLSEQILPTISPTQDVTKIVECIKTNLLTSGQQIPKSCENLGQTGGTPPIFGGAGENPISKINACATEIGKILKQPLANILGPIQSCLTPQK